MLAVLWIGVTFAFGWQLLGGFLGHTDKYLQPLANSLRPSLKDTAPPLLMSLLLKATAAFWIGLLLGGWLTYLTATFLAVRLPININPLTIIHPIFIVMGFIILLASLAGKYFVKTKTQDSPEKTVTWAHYIHSLQQPRERFILVSLILFAVFGIWLMRTSFYQQNSWLHAGYSVFSDFAPHTALISSFSTGRNFPAAYPHFAGDGIAYHFMFFFISSQLYDLGLPFSLAINLPSIMGLISFCVMAGSLAYKLTGHVKAFLLTPGLLFLRSSMAFWTWLRDVIFYQPDFDRSFSSIWQLISKQETWIGHTPRDDWGLWGLNVYANQRHLLPGMALLFFIILLMLPDYIDGYQNWQGWKKALFSKGFWQWQRPADRKRAYCVLLLCLMLPFFHGSATVALLLILMGMALFSINKVSYLLIGLATFIAAQIQTAYFAGINTASISPTLQFGFIAPDQTMKGVLIYLLEMSGLVFIIWLLMLFKNNRLLKPLMVCFIFPLIFAFTVSLTPDITVNHKFIMITIAFTNIFAAQLLIELWQQRQAFRLPAKIVALSLAILLTITGFQEILIFRNINQRTLAINLEDDVVTWIRQYTRPDAVFLTAPYHYHAFFLSGRYTYFGHSYYAWSAGHDTATRHERVQWLLSGGEGDPVKTKAVIRGEKIDYLLIDDELRNHSEFNLNESFFKEHFELIISFEDSKHTAIYGLR